MIWFWGVMGLGLIAAVVFGSIAWYNSEKPAGWEFADNEKPNWADQDWAKPVGPQGEPPKVEDIRD